MSEIVLTLMFLLLFLVAVMASLLGPFVGLGFAMWSQHKAGAGGPDAQENAAPANPRTSP